MRFFTEAEGWREVPAEIDTPVLWSAMAVLEEARAERQQALADQEKALAREAQERAENERLRARLRALGVDPEAE